MIDVIHNEGVGALEVGRVAGRFEQVLFEFIDGFLDAKASRAGPASSVARSLILGVYRHHIREICEWLEELVEAIADPAFAIQKRSIKAAANVKLTVALNMTSPPEMAKLATFVKNLCQKPDAYANSSPRFEESEVPAPGLLGTIGALAFGIGMTKAVLGRNHV